MTPMTTTQVSDYLKSKGIRPSVQRIAILRYLIEHPVHPTAEEIHAGLVAEMPSLSLTTVYNTLNCLVAAGSDVAMLTHDSRNTRFDFVREPHAHLYCRSCGAVIDVTLTETQLPGMSCDAGFQVENVDVCYRGLCRNCRKNN